MKDWIELLLIIGFGMCLGMWIRSAAIPSVPGISIEAHNSLIIMNSTITINQQPGN